MEEPIHPQVNRACPGLLDTYKKDWEECDKAKKSPLFFYFFELNRKCIEHFASNRKKMLKVWPDAVPKQPWLHLGFFSEINVIPKPSKLWAMCWCGFFGVWLTVHKFWFIICNLCHFFPVQNINYINPLLFLILYRLCKQWYKIKH